MIKHEACNGSDLDATEEPKYSQTADILCFFFLEGLPFLDRRR